METKHLSSIRFLDIKAPMKGRQLSGLSFSVYRSKKTTGVTFSYDISAELVTAGYCRVRIGVTETGRVLFLFNKEQGVSVSHQGRNVVLNSKNAHKALMRELKLTPAPGTEFRRVYTLRKGFEDGLYIVEDDK